MRHLLLALLLGLPVLAIAQYANTAEMGHSGSDYLRFCEASSHGEQSRASIPCVAFLDGVIDGFRIYGVASHVHLYSLPQEVTLAQLEEIVVKYMKNHPKQLSLSTAALVLWALEDTYPPKKH